MRAKATILEMATSEREFQRQVLELAGLKGWLAHHTRPAMTSKGYRTPIQGHVGFVDLVLAHPQAGRLVLAELKAECGRLSPHQRVWLDALGRCPGVTVAVWRPSDWEDIKRVLDV